MKKTTIIIFVSAMFIALTGFKTNNYCHELPCYTEMTEALYGGYIRNNSDGSRSLVIWKRDNTMQAPKIISDKITNWDCGDLQNWAAKNNLTFIAPR